MKLSVSLRDDDVEFIDDYADEHGVETRSAVVRRALSLLRTTRLGEDYAAAWQEWSGADADIWETTAGDGLGRTAPA